MNSVVTAKNLQKKSGIQVLPRGASCRESACQCRRLKRQRFHPWIGKIPWRRAWQPSPVFLSGESYLHRNLLAYLVHKFAKSWTWLKQLSMHPCRHTVLNKRDKTLDYHETSKGKTNFLEMNRFVCLWCSWKYNNCVFSKPSAYRLVDP